MAALLPGHDDIVPSEWICVHIADQNSAATAIAIRAVASQPSAWSHTGNASVRLPTRGVMTIIMTAMIGTATTPLMTAVQNSMAIGSRLESVSPAPARV